jgi:hypothetical protein
MADLRQLLLDIRERHGTLTPSIVLDEARDPDSPLHHRFEWDDGAAAEKWRLHQAGNLLRVKFRRNTDGGVQEVRAFWPVREGEDDGAEAPHADYRPIREVVEDPVARQVMLNSMVRDANSFRRRYAHMQEFADIVQRELLDDSNGNGNGDGQPTPPDRQSA